MNGTRIKITGSTGDNEFDEILCGLIGIFDTAFPARIRAYYLLDGPQGTTGTLMALFKGHIEQNEQEMFQGLSAHCAMLGAETLALRCTGESGFVRRDVGPALFLYGQDVLNRELTQPLQGKLRRTRVYAFREIWLLRGRPAGLAYPLDYPDPRGEFFGYERYGYFQDGDHFVAGLRTMVNAATLISIALMAQLAGIQVDSSGRSVELYRHFIGDKWADFLEMLFITCKDEWEYQIPTEPEDCHHLRTLTARMLEFENYFLRVSRESLLNDLKSNRPNAQRMARECLEYVQYADSEFTAVQESLQINLLQQESDLAFPAQRSLAHFPQ